MQRRWLVEAQVDQGPQRVVAVLRHLHGTDLIGADVEFSCWDALCPPRVLVQDTIDGKHRGCSAGTVFEGHLSAKCRAMRRARLLRAQSQLYVGVAGPFPVEVRAPAAVPEGWRSAVLSILVGACRGRPRRAPRFRRWTPALPRRRRSGPPTACRRDSGSNFAPRGTAAARPAGARRCRRNGRRTPDFRSRAPWAEWRTRQNPRSVKVSDGHRMISAPCSARLAGALRNLGLVAHVEADLGEGKLDHLDRIAFLRRPLRFGRKDVRLLVGVNQSVGAVEVGDVEVSAVPLSR